MALWRPAGEGVETPLPPVLFCLSEAATASSETLHVPLVPVRICERMQVV
jgi:hypothetical protein